MRSPRLVLALFVALIGCGDDGSNPNNDGGGSGSDGGGSGSDGGMQCELPPELPSCANPVNGTDTSLVQIGGGPIFSAGTDGDAAALLVTSPPRDPRLFVVGRGGKIRIIDENGTLITDPFFDLATTVTNLESGSEQGLLGLAFHPQYACNRQFFVFYTASGGSPYEDVVLRCTASATDPNKADNTCTPILRIPDCATNHNGGMIEFGNDGYLYIGTGDGGSGGDPRRNGQALNNMGTQTVALLGKMLRIDVDNRDPDKEYAIPPSNPFAGGGGAPEIWMYGLRNPWRWSFDRETGDIWIGDVGQIKTEELTAIKAGEQSGKNLGWSVWEGDRCCQTLGQNDGLPDPDNSPNGCEQNGTQQTCDMNAPGLVFPQAVYRHPTWISIIGGQTYRGTCFPDLVGWHLYTDHSSQGAGLHRARFMAGSNDLEVFDYPLNDPALPSSITSIHADARGELYVTRLNGTVYHVVAAP
ncbi:MAG: sorbosone dehydrogenase family protein [Kofleriaceae bacterium]